MSWSSSKKWTVGPREGCSPTGLDSSSEGLEEAMLATAAAEGAVPS